MWEAWTYVSRAGPGAPQVRKGTIRMVQDASRIHLLVKLTRLQAHAVGAPS